MLVGTPAERAEEEKFGLAAIAPSEVPLLPGELSKYSSPFQYVIVARWLLVVGAAIAVSVSYLDGDIPRGLIVFLLLSIGLMKLHPGRELVHAPEDRPARVPPVLHPGRRRRDHPLYDRAHDAASAEVRDDAATADAGVRRRRRRAGGQRGQIAKAADDRCSRPLADGVVVGLLADDRLCRGDDAARAPAGALVGPSSPGCRSVLGSSPLTTWLASDWPVHDVAERSLYSVHMVQHLTFTSIAAPLLLGTPAWLLALGARAAVLFRCVRVAGVLHPGDRFSTTSMLASLSHGRRGSTRRSTRCLALLRHVGDLRERLIVGCVAQPAARDPGLPSPVRWCTCSCSRSCRPSRPCSSRSARRRCTRRTSGSPTCWACRLSRISGSPVCS